MPDEVLSARQVVVVRKQVVLCLVAVLVMLIAWFGLSWWQTRSAESGLSDLQRQGLALQSQQSQFTPLVSAQAQIANTRSQLETLMVGDLSWKTMLTTVRAKAPAGVTPGAIHGTVTGVTSTSGQTSVLNQTGSATIGELTVGGYASSRDSIAAYADALGKVNGLTAPLITNVQATGEAVGFTFTVVITTDVLGGRYATATETPVSSGGN
jgi:Tfp pilus assembly protein PilN